MIKNIITGLLLGFANIVPGLSGGTIIVILGIYQKLIDNVYSSMRICEEAVKQIFTKKENRIKEYKDKSIGKIIIDTIIKLVHTQKSFLIPIILGMLITIFLLATMFDNMNDSTKQIRDFMFTGLIIGGIPPIIIELYIGKKNAVKQTKKDVKEIILNLIPGICTFLIMLTLYILKTKNIMLQEFDIQNIGIVKGIIITIVGLVASASMIIPGISGSLLMIILGHYNSMTKAIKNMQLSYIIPLAIGIILGLLIMIKVLKRLLEKYYIKTFSAILGFTVGSILIIYPKTENNDKIMQTTIALLLGIIISVLLTVVSKKLKKGNMDSMKDAKNSNNSRNINNS